MARAIELKIDSPSFSKNSRYISLHNVNTALNIKSGEEDIIRKLVAYAID